MWPLIFAVLLLAANAFFVAAEFALIAARAARLEAEAKEGNRASSQALKAVRDLQPRLAGAQLGITMASLGLGFFAEPAVAHLIEAAIDNTVSSKELSHTIAFILALAIVVPVHVVIGEMVPKNIAIAEPEQTARKLALPLQAYVILFKPLIWLLNGLSNSIVRAMGLQPVDEINTALTVKEFHTLIAGALDEGVIKASEHELLSGALEFREHSAGSLMVPTNEMVSVPRNTTVAKVEQVVASSGHTRVPIWGATSNDILGFIHAKDLLRIPVDMHSEQIPVEIIRRMIVTHPDVSAKALMGRMRRHQVHIALVRTEESVLGIVTLEDVIESLVGEIYDETDRR